MPTHDYNYCELLARVLRDGDLVENRTGTDTYSLLGVQQTYNIHRDGFPVLTSKLVRWKSALAEMLWFISGECDTLDGLGKYKKLWEPWADEHGGLGPIYGVQWRNWQGHEQADVTDQLSDVIEQIKSGSTSRRLIVTAWRPDEISAMSLPPCHVMFQFTVRAGFLHLQLYQRSCDLPIGGPFNVAQYSMLLAMVAKLANLKPGSFIHSIHDVHIYVNQVDGVKAWIKQYMNRSGYAVMRQSPKLVIHGAQQSIDDFKFEDFELEGYGHCGRIKLPLAV